ncbi:hypothetical protein KC973_03370 [Candidatus Saccharibacteria bacterium]|nr:hypothetical protein [Candidatus Saccharibacteria bacterium]
MEKNKGASSHFVGIIRVVVLAVVLFLLVFLFTRWAVSRRQQNNESSKTTTSKTSDAKTSDKDTSKAAAPEDGGEDSTSQAENNDSSVSQTDEGVSGIDHLPATTPETPEQQPTGKVPNTGPESTALSVILISTIVYMVGLNRAIKQKHTASL